jgi:hypothetical protein
MPSQPSHPEAQAAQPFAEIWNVPKMRRFRKIISRRLFPGTSAIVAGAFLE